jgi:hypothetical protein
MRSEYRGNKIDLVSVQRSDQELETYLGLSITLDSDIECFGKSVGEGQREKISIDCQQQSMDGQCQVTRCSKFPPLTAAPLCLSERTSGILVLMRQQVYLKALISTHRVFLPIGAGWATLP